MGRSKGEDKWGGLKARRSGRSEGEEKWRFEGEEKWEGYSRG